jgi:hypothetical protein
MALEWKKIGRGCWYGEEGSWRYTIDQKPFPLTGGYRFYVTRGGIASRGYFGSAPSLAGAKRLSHDDMIEREARIMSLPNAAV